MISFFQKHHRQLFYSAWLLLSLAQSAATGLIADEAYYWVYSKFLSWGYFDHPPMIAVLIKTGDAIFHHELGVRLICALLSTLTILITESLTEKKNPFLFYTIVLGIGVLQIAGFIAVPDTPLLFFTAVFFYVYRRFTQTINWQTAFLLGFSIAMLFYTKYHGLLIVVFTMLSNIKLIKRWQTWFAGLVVLVLYAPHLLWQSNHDWVSFRYHLFESNVSAYKISYTLDYLVGQLLLAGPLIGFILLPAAFIYKTKNQLEKALKFALYGIYLVFLMSSFRGKVEVNWTMPGIIPLIVLSHQFIIDRVSWMKPIRIVSFISLLLIIAGRLYLVVDIGPGNAVKRRFHHNRSWANAIHAKTRDTPVVFYNSYQRASLFWFYTGKLSHSHNPYWDRRNNYNFWPTESDLLGKRVFIADIYGVDKYPDSAMTKKGTVGLRPDSIYSALGGIKLVPERTIISADAIRTHLLIVHLSATIPEKYLSFIIAHPEIKTELVAGVFNGKVLVKEFNLGTTAQQIANWKAPFRVSLDLKDVPENAIDELKFGIRSKDYLVTHNSEKITLVGF